MKAVLLAFAVMLVCVLYEMDREFRLAAAWHSQLDAGSALKAQPRDLGLRIPHDSGLGGPAILPAPHAAGAPGIPAGTVEHEQSIRLFGPGVSRRQQIRV